MDRVVEAVEGFRFDAAAVDHLTATGVVTDPVLADWLRDYRFGGDITGYPDGELFFPYSPVLTIEGTFAECVVLETVVLSILNHDCAVASAAARMRDAAPGSALLDGGSRRTDPSAAVAAAKAAYVGGFDATSNLEAGRRWRIPTGGTTAHAFMLLHDHERAAFAAQRDTLGVESTYLVDTFDVLAGVRHAVEAVGPNLGAVRIDSGNLLSGSLEVRALLNELGAGGCKIVASGDLDEYRIADLQRRGAPIDSYLVGTRLVTGSGHPAASLVYKLVAVADLPSAAGAGAATQGGSAKPAHPATASAGASRHYTAMREVGKFSSGKATVGGRKQVHRTIDADGYWVSEVLSLADDGSLSTEVSHPGALQPQVPLVVSGKRAYGDTAHEARSRCAERRARLRPEDRTPHPVRTPAVATEWVGWKAPVKPLVYPQTSQDGGSADRHEAPAQLGLELAG